MRRFFVHSLMKYGPDPTTGAETPSGLTGMFAGMPQKNGIARRASRSGARFDIRIRSVYAFGVVTPEAREARPSMTAEAPAMSSMNG